MKRLSFALLAGVLLFHWVAPAAAQDQAAEAARIAERREAEERYKRLAATVEDMKDAFAVYQKRLSTLADEVHKLREENLRLREEQSRGLAGLITREEFRKLAEKLQEIESKRDSDKKLILEEIQKLAKAAASAPVPDRKTHNSSPAELEENFYLYEVQPGNTLSAIITAYNAEMKKQGKPTVTLDQVLKANPKLNRDNVRTGQKIRIPLPPPK